MKKLLSITTRYSLVLILVVLVVWSAVLYSSLRWVIYQDIDEYLISRNHEIQKSLQINPELITAKPLYKTDFSIKEIKESEYSHFLKKYKFAKFKDTKIFDELENEDEPFRKMESVFTYENRCYKLTIFASVFNSEEMLVAILFNIFILSVLLLSFIYILNRLLLRRLWKPFYETLLKVKQYKLDKEKQVELPYTKIVEFKELNDSIESLIQNNLSVYKSQKQFIENASHEMQTPVGVIQNKVYMLMEEPGLTNGQSVIIDDITKHIERLSRLNKTLLLLSKIENHQFSENESIDIPELISTCCEDFTELIEFKQLDLTITLQGNPVIQMNMDLARILFSNLITNAINHNIQKGFISIVVDKFKVTFTNSGRELILNPETLFERFNKHSNSSQSNGLGLSIVKTICNLYHLTIRYSYQENIHSISISF